MIKISVEMMLDNSCTIGNVVGTDGGVNVQLFERVYSPMDWEKSTVSAALAQCVRAREAALR
jgi:hypothetical protein